MLPVSLDGRGTEGSAPPVSGDAAVPASVASSWAVWQLASSTGRWPFDAARQWHAIAVQAGWLRNSLLDARDFEHLLDAQERVMLGPLARRV